MSKRGESLLVGIGMMPKKKPAEADDPEVDDESAEESDADEEGGEELPEHVLMSAEKLCRLYGVDEEKAPELGKLIRAIAMG